MQAKESPQDTFITNIKVKLNHSGKKNITNMAQNIVS